MTARWVMRMRGRGRARWLFLGALLLAFPLGCGADDLSGSYTEDEGRGVDGGGDGDGDGDGNIDVDAPEEELEETFRAPVVSGPYLWSANPDSNKVARINSSTLDIDVFEAGNGPTFLSALPAGATPGGALILNVRSHDVSIFLLKDEPEAPPVTFNLPVQQGASALSVGALGGHAVVWSRASEGLLNQEDGYQDITVLNFQGDSPQAQRLSVGFRPSQVSINDAETRAFVVSDPGISVLELGEEAQIVREIFLPEQSGSQRRDVIFSRDGSLALVRLEGSSEVLIVNTETGAEASLDFPGVVTDLDLSGDGQTAVVVVRGGQSPLPGGGENAGGAGGISVDDPQSTVALLPMDTIFTSPDDFISHTTKEIVGSAVVADDSSQILLFTNANANPHLSLLSTGLGASAGSPPAFRVMDLKAPLSAAFLSEDGAYGVALMTPPAGSTKAGAFALVPVLSDLPARIEGTDTPPQYVSVSGATGRAMITTEASASGRAKIFFGRFPGLRVDEIQLVSRPLASGMVPEAGQGFVAQAHPEGRVTFIELESGKDKTVTGFELASKVVE